MVRAPFYDKNGVKKGAWSPEEDHKLRTYIQRYGHCNWRELPKYAGLKRCGKSCRLRLMNYLRPEVKHGNYTEEEDALIMKLHEQFGNRWSTIAASLPGRTDNEIKNHWHSHLIKKRAKRKRTTTSQNSLINSVIGEAGSELVDTPTNIILESCPFSRTKSSSTSELSSFSLDSGSTISSCLNSTISGTGTTVEDICGLSSPDIYDAQSSGYFWSEPFVLDNIYEEDGYPLSLGRGGLGLPVPYDMYYDDSADFFRQLWP